MTQGFFICRGDKTTCGGQVLDGDARIDMFGLFHARMGDRVTCGKDGKTYQILGGIGHMVSHGKPMAGTLDSRSGCPCRAEIIPSSRDACYHNATPAPQMMRTAAESPSSALGSASALRQSAFVPSPSPAAPFVRNDEPQEPGFYVVTKSMSREALEATLFPQPDPEVMRKFRALNPGMGDLKAGSMIVLSDPKNHLCMREEALLMEAAQQISNDLEPLTPDEADFMQRHGAEIAGFTGETSTWLGVSAAVMERHIARMRDTLIAIERLDHETYRQHGHLKTPEFHASRKRLLSQLDAHLLNSTQLRGYTSLGEHPKLKTSLGLSTKSLVHHWDKAGAPGQIPDYATHVSAASRAAKYMATGGYIAIGIGGVSSLLAVQEVCSEDPGAACEKVKFVEGGKFSGATAGGMLGGWAGGAAAGSICLAIGASTAGIGGVVCVGVLIGTGAWVGTTIGGQTGEKIGERLYQNTQP